jgi:hypothetical protein
MIRRLSWASIRLDFAVGGDALAVTAVRVPQVAEHRGTQVLLGDEPLCAGCLDPGCQPVEGVGEVSTTQTPALTA